MIPIAYARSYSAVVQGQLPKLVACEHCGLEYVYLLERSAQGEGTSFLFLDNAGAQHRAHQRAERRLRAKLERDFDPVPCPACGWYQAAMVPRLRKLRHGWMPKTGVALLPLAVILGLAAAIAQGVAEREPGHAAFAVALLLGAGALAAVAAAPALPLLKWALCRDYDPNAEDVEVRKQRGRERAVPKDDFLRRARRSRPASEVA
jgi:hypothetical protein